MTRQQPGPGDPGRHRAGEARDPAGTALMDLLILLSIAMFLVVVILPAILTTVRA